MKTKSPLLYLLSFIFYLALSPLPCALSQIPQGFNYQAIARDGSGNPIANTSLPARITIQADSLGSTILWQELHSSVTSNSFGMINLVIGRGTRQSASTVATFNDINWSITPKFIKTEIFYNSEYKTMGVSRLWSVPFAMYSTSTHPWLLNGSSLYYASGYVGINTSTPATPLTVTLNNNTGITYPLYIVNASGDWTATEKGVGLKFGRINPTSGHDYGTIIGTIASASGGEGRLQLIGGGGTTPHMTINHLGNVGIGTTNPGNKLEVNGGITSSGLTIASGVQTGLQIYKSDNSTDQKRTELISLGTSGSFVGRFVNDAYTLGEAWLNVARNTGTYTVNSVTFPSGKVGIGVASSTSKVAIQPESTWSDEVPLFEVKNKLGVPVLAVYNNGVRILVDHTLSKGVKSGFAVGGYDMTKAGKTVDLMIISPDSIRFNINNDNTKGVKSGFAVGGYDATKGTINQDFMYLTPQNSGNGKYNTFIGYKSGSNTGGSTLYSNYNTFIGYQAGYSNIYGYSNVFLGYNAGYSNVGSSFGTSGYNNVYIGQLAGEKNNGTNNVFIGDDAGKALTGGSKNVIIGSAAGLQTTGNYNTYIGAGAGRSETGNDNVMIGYNASLGSGESDVLVIGNRNKNALISGSFSSSKIYLWGMVGINTGTPASYLEIAAPGNPLRLTRSGTSNYFDLGIGSEGYLRVNNQTNSGAYCTGASWVNSSDMNLKENFIAVDCSEILAKVDDLPVTSWNYKGDSEEIRHIGPVAQDFYKVFGLGNDNKSISTIDPAGISFIAIKELSRKNQVQQKQIESLQQQIDRLESLVEQLMNKGSVQTP